MEIKEIIKLKGDEYDLLRCRDCNFRVYMDELKMFKSCRQCGSKNIEVLR